MGLQNLVGISLELIKPAKETVKRLLDAAGRRIADAKVKQGYRDDSFLLYRRCNGAGRRQAHCDREGGNQGSAARYAYKT
jgi:hypothetical protein